MSSPMEQLLLRHVQAGTILGATAVVGPADAEPEVVAVGSAAVGGPPMRADAIMRIQSMTKAITAVAALRLVEAGRLGLDDGLAEWLPELVDRRVLTSPTAELDDTVVADRPITLRHLLTNGSGYGMALVESPLQRAMAANGTEAGSEPVSLGADEWLARLADLPPAFQPGVGVEVAGSRVGRCGWSGGQGTTFYVDPDGTVAILLTQVELDEPLSGLLAEFQQLGSEAAG